MLTLEDCIALCGLTREEVDAIAEHEHLPEAIAAELAFYLLQLPDGRQAIKAMIRDDITRAQLQGHYHHSAKLKLVLRHFIEHCHHEVQPQSSDKPRAAHRG